jgi:ABC-type nitrate/sulfonate/bicarbonate transport system substrate-binding protein
MIRFGWPSTVVAAAVVLAWLRQNGTKADAVFLVPVDPEELLAGLAN